MGLPKCFAVMAFPSCSGVGKYFFFEGECCECEGECRFHLQNSTFIKLLDQSRPSHSPFNELFICLSGKWHIHLQRSTFFDPGNRGRNHLKCGFYMKKKQKKGSFFVPTPLHDSKKNSQKVSLSPEG